MDTLNDHRLEKAKQSIDTVDLTSTINRLIKVHKWTKKQALTAANQYRNYLFLKIKYSERDLSLPPSFDIDEVWHAHILHTQDYMEFCEQAFGYYLHHHPHHGKNNIIADADLAFTFENETQKLYFAEFGKNIKAVRPLPWFLIIKRLIEHLKTTIKFQKLVSTRIERI